MNPVPRPCVCTTIRRASRILSRVYDDALAGTGMNITQLAVMRAVSRHENEPLSRVAEDLCMDRTTLYRALDPLVKRNWISVSEGNDSRCRSASILPDGLEALARADEPWSDIQRATVEKFGTEQWNHFVAELARLQSVIEGEK